MEIRRTCSISLNFVMRIHNVVNGQPFVVCGPIFLLIPLERTTLALNREDFGAVGEHTGIP